MKITESELFSAISYDPKTGIFTWLIDRHCRFSIKKGDRAGSSLPFPDGKRYRRLCVNGKFIFEHRAAFMFMGCPLKDDEEADHENGNGEDNRWSNIKRSTRKKNAKNLRRSSNNTSGVTGVAWDKRNKKWSVTIGKKHLGRFSNFDDAVNVRKQAEIDHDYHQNHGSDRPL